MGSIKRRKWGIAVVVVMLLAACGGAGGTPTQTSDADPTDQTPESPATQDPGEQSFEGQTLRVGMFSEQGADWFMEGFGDEFEADTGAEIEWVVASTDVNVTRILAAPEAPDIDVMMVSNHDVWPLDDAGLVVPVDYGRLENANNVDEGAQLETGPGIWYFDLGICYNTDKYAENNLDAPTGVESLFDPGLAGRVALPDSASGFFNTMVQPLAEHMGLPTDDPDPFIERMSELEPGGFFNANADATELFQSEEVWAGIFSGRCLSWKEEGLPFELAPVNLEIDGTTYPYFGYIFGVSLIEGGNTDLGYVFMDYAISDDGILPYEREVTFTPTIQPVMEVLLDDPAKAAIIHEDPSTIYLPDYADFWRTKADWVNAWNRLFR